MIPLLSLGQSAEDYRQKGNQLAKEKKYVEAKINFLLSKELNPYNWELYRDIGWMHYNNKNYTGAIEEYESGKILAPNQDLFYNFLGFCYLAIGKNEDAILNFSKWIELNTDSNGNFIEYSKLTASVILNNRGLAYLYSGNQNLACEDWQYAKRLHLSDADKWIDQYCQ